MEAAFINIVSIRYVANLRNFNTRRRIFMLKIVGVGEIEEKKKIFILCAVLK